TAIEEAKELATLPLDELVRNLIVYKMILENKDLDEEEEDEDFNLMARNFRKFFRKGCRFTRGNQFGNGGNRFSKGQGNSFRNKDGESSKQKGAFYNCKIEVHFASKGRNPKENKAYVRGA
nr:hypothetical protein [Tanacetum cinerariifolium]